MSKQLRTNTAGCWRYVNAQAHRVPVVMDIISECEIQTINDVKGKKMMLRVRSVLEDVVGDMGAYKGFT